MRKTESTILIIDDDADVVFASKVYLKRFFISVLTMTSPRNIHEVLLDHQIDVVLLDMNYGAGKQDGHEGIYWLESIKEMSPQTVVILMTAYSDVNVAIDGIKKGAFDFIQKPWENEKLLATVNAGVQLARSLRKSSKLVQINQQSVNENTDVVFGKSPAFSKVNSTVNKVAATDATALLLGENGTGKHVVANLIHERSLRKNEVFVHVDLGSLSETLFESELFGHVKGAFTGAHESSIGRFELAEGGTIFLDEIGNVPLHLQAKLLAVLQNREITRIGEAQARKINVRIICATNLDLYKAVEEKEFRQDLLYRINTVEITIPPLRKRKEDIEDLAIFFLEKNKKKYRKGKLQLSEGALTAMYEYSWPGNIRELEHLLERAVILCEESEIGLDDLQFSNSKESGTTPETLNLEVMEKYLVEQALKKHHGNISGAAKELGLTRAALYRRLEKHNL